MSVASRSSPGRFYGFGYQPERRLARRDNQTTWEHSHDEKDRSINQSVAAKYNTCWGKRQKQDREPSKDKPMRNADDETQTRESPREVFFDFPPLLCGRNSVPSAPVMRAIEDGAILGSFKLQLAFELRPTPFRGIDHRFAKMLRVQRSDAPRLPVSLAASAEKSKEEAWA